MIDTEIIQLRDGTPISIRRVTVDDAPRLMAMHERLSDQTRFLRYMGIARHLAQAEAREMCTIHSNADMALVASSLSDPDSLIGIAFYTALDDQPDTAEIAIVIEDAWQKHGLGRLMLERLTTYAVYHGIRVFTAAVNWENSHILRFIERSGLPAIQLLNQGVYEISVMLPTLEEFVLLQSGEQKITGTN
jgi:RimJ/RimL family protein N-acetyltransferase